jgi:hypothetical protein
MQGLNSSLQTGIRNLVEQRPDDVGPPKGLDIPDANSMMFPATTGG